MLLSCFNIIQANKHASQAANASLAVIAQLMTKSMYRIATKQVNPLNN